MSDTGSLTDNSQSGYETDHSSITEESSWEDICEEDNDASVEGGSDMDETNVVGTQHELDIEVTSNSSASQNTLGVGSQSSQSSLSSFIVPSFSSSSGDDSRDGYEEDRLSSSSSCKDNHEPTASTNFKRRVISDSSEAETSACASDRRKIPRLTFSSDDLEL